MKNQKNAPGGAHGRHNNKGGEKRIERFPFWVNAFVNAALSFLDGQAGVRYIGRKKTVLSTAVARTGRSDLVATVVNSAVKMVHYFGIEIAEAADTEGMYSRVVCTPNGQPLPESKLRSDRNGNPIKDRRSDEYVYNGLSHVAVVICRGQYGRLQVCIYGFTSNTKTHTSIGLSEKKYELPLPADLVARFFQTGGDDAPLPTLEQTEALIQTAIQAERKEEELAPFTTAMAVAYLKSCGQQISMRDQAETETKEEAPKDKTSEPREEDKVTEATPTETEQTDEVIDPQAVAEAQAAAQKPQSRKKATKGKKKTATKKTGKKAATG